MASEQAGSVLKRIRERQAEASEGNGGGGGMPEKVLFIPVDGVKVVRVLQELDDAYPVIMHQHGRNWKKMKPQPCLKYYGEKCPFCSNDQYDAIEHYAVTVWDYEAEARRVWLIKVSPGFSAMDDLLEITDENGVLRDRDLKVRRKPLGKNKSQYKVKALDKAKFQGGKDKPYSKDKVFAILKDLIRVREIGEDDDEGGDDGDGGDDDE